MKVTIDFETRSEADLGKVGAWMYSRHPSTEVLCLGWHAEYDEQETSGQWRMGDAPPTDLFDFTRDPNCLVEAHNSFFEMSVWLNVCHTRYKWPLIYPYQWRCSAAKAAQCALPRALGSAGKALALSVVKDEADGKWSMMKLSRPRKPTKKDPSKWHDDPKDWEAMLKYNMNDVAAERALSSALPNLPHIEQELFELSEAMNLRGIPIDRGGIVHAIRQSGEYARRLTDEFQRITGLDTAGQRARFLVWMRDHGVDLPNTTAKTLDDWLAGDWPADDERRRAVEIVRTLGRSSIKKYRKMLDCADTDDRMRGLFLFDGASTGRWAGRDVQPHNFPRGNGENQDAVWELIHNDDLETIDLITEPTAFFSAGLRGAICAPPGREFKCGDFAQIEARVLLLEAGDQPGLDAFRRKEDIYCRRASLIFNRPITKKDTKQRFLGKQAELALGFGAGFVKFLVHCRALGAPPFSREQVCELVPANQRSSIYQWILNDGWDMVTRLIPAATKKDAMELVLTKYVVDQYRKQVKDTVVKLWNSLENAARMAIQNPGKLCRATPTISYRVDGMFLKCRLRSGRFLYYPYPEINGKRIRYMTADDRGQFTHTETYGGKLTENVVQATARDVMANSMIALDRSELYNEIDATIHDEILVETDEGVGSVEEFAEIMSQPPEWAIDLPIEVEAWSGRRYHK